MSMSVRYEARSRNKPTLDKCAARTTNATIMYHLLKGLHEYLTRSENTLTSIPARHSKTSHALSRTGRTSFPSLLLASMARARRCAWLRLIQMNCLLIPFLQTLLEKIKTIYNDTPGLPPDKIAPTVGQNSTRLSYSSLATFALSVIHAHIP
jgi:hypothetical protein